MMILEFLTPKKLKIKKGVPDLLGIGRICLKMLHFSLKTAKNALILPKNS